MKNKLVDLNNHLFAQLERIADEDLTQEELETEIKRTRAVTSIGKVIVDNANLNLKAIKAIKDYGLSKNETPIMLNGES